VSKQPAPAMMRRRPDSIGAQARRRLRQGVRRAHVGAGARVGGGSMSSDAMLCSCGVRACRRRLPGTGQRKVGRRRPQRNEVGTSTDESRGFEMQQS
jgi:predicted alpha/beta-hydrolase family hydrolase